MSCDGTGLENWEEVEVRSSGAPPTPTPTPTPPLPGEMAAGLAHKVWGPAESGLREPRELERLGWWMPDSLWKMREDLLSTVRMLGDLSVVEVECDHTPLD
jgi:hypothetical protein